jgi:hypothetical protein
MQSGSKKEGGGDARCYADEDEMILPSVVLVDPVYDSRCGEECDGGYCRATRAGGA